jgi:hypothetical protein
VRRSSAQLQGNPTSGMTRRGARRAPGGRMTGTRNLPRGSRSPSEERTIREEGGRRGAASAPSGSNDEVGPASAASAVATGPQAGERPGCLCLHGRQSTSMGSSDRWPSLIVETRKPRRGEGVEGVCSSSIGSSSSGMRQAGQQAAQRARPACRRPPLAPTNTLDV